uniref:Violacin-A n=1 Tax=Viola odorata TaxID=97441 RepID=VIOLA_VIOOD|nr:RecName: Full=Violacin-A; AltName: Full=Violacin-1; Flags: Precursor [Viola odorata]ABC94585.1 violacin 1 precursor [Viola odorata]
MDAQKMKMVIGLVLVATTAFALMIPAASAVDDFITRRAYDNLVKSGAIKDIPVMAKTIISNPVLEEGMLTYYTNKKLGDSAISCGETCFKFKCYTPRCSCSYPVCK